MILEKLEGVKVKIMPIRSEAGIHAVAFAFNDILDDWAKMTEEFAMDLTLGLAASTSTTQWAQRQALGPAPAEPSGPAPERVAIKQWNQFKELNFFNLQRPRASGKGRASENVAQHKGPAPAEKLPPAQAISVTA
ncbi:hypothetical protein B0H19DRAFT_1060264 [Mycena capillaripes]|nr:hypothetical protein B0H19DRAFT_1060264 [Mycena capillaripes]